MLDMLLDAFDAVEDSYVVSAAQTLGYLPKRKKKPVVRYLLIAAALTALLAATAMAANLYGRAQRLAEMPASPEGEQRAALIPNGVQGNPTFQGSAEWWAFMAQWEDTHDPMDMNFDLEFTKGDLDQYNICSLYNAYDEAQADKLYEIADQYDLKLYEEQLYFDDYGGKQFFELTGCKPFASSMEESRFSGYVFDDGSFHLETDVPVNGKPFSAAITRIRSGSIFPYGGASTDPVQHEEVEYVNKKGQQLILDTMPDSPYSLKANLTYVTPDGKTWLDVKLYDFLVDIEDPLQAAKDLSEALDFEALAVQNEKAREILSVNTGAEDNRSTVEKLEAFRHSDAVKATEEFNVFFTENFYGSTFAGTYGMEGYADIDEKLSEIAEKYGLSYAKQKNKGNSLYENAVCYDNGAWNAEFVIDRWNSRARIHYIPKNALYTAWVPPLPMEEYRRIWEYETKDGFTLLCYSEGPSVVHGSGAILETESAYIFMPFGGTRPQDLQAAADLVDWAKISKEG